MIKFFIPILSYCIITVASLTSNVSCAEASSKDNDQRIVDNATSRPSDLSISNDQKNPLLEIIPPKLGENVERYMIDPATLNFIYLLQEPLSIHTGGAYIEGNFPGTKNCRSWEIDNSEETLNHYKMPKNNCRNK
jgi:hypothetical protein